MAHRLKLRPVQILSMTLALCACSMPPAFAYGKGGGKGGSGTESDAAFSIIDLVGPYHDVDRGSQTNVQSISNVSQDGKVHVLGYYVRGAGTDSKLCVWTVDSNRNVSVLDLAGIIETESSVKEDINSAGVICGEIDARPALVMPNLQTVFLSEAETPGYAVSINDPNSQGVFQVVGTSNAYDPYSYKLWYVHLDGTVLAEVTLVDDAGNLFSPFDLQNSGAMGGITLLPDGSAAVAVGVVDAAGHLQISPRMSPFDADTYLTDPRVDDQGNLIANGSRAGSLTDPALWLGETPIPLTSVSSSIRQAYGIASVDDVPFIVGRGVQNGEAFAFLYTPGTFSDLGPLSQGADSWILQRALGINRSGMICGAGRVGRRHNFEFHAFLLIPN